MSEHEAPANALEWREYFRPIVAELCEMIETCGMSEDDARREFKAAWKIQVDKYNVPSPWPKQSDDGRIVWGESYPYMIWRDEIAQQRGTLIGRILRRGERLWEQREAEKAGQLRMFDDPR